MSDDPRSDETTEAPADAGAIGNVDDSDFWDDDDGWDDRSPRRGSGGGGGVPPAWIIGIVVVALVVIAALVVRGGKDDSNDTASGDGGQTTQPADGGEQCATWPGIGGLGRPPIADEPGIHVWSDLEGWHVNRVPGAGVPAVTAVITNNDADNPPKAKEGATGGATAAMDGATLSLLIPDGTEPAEASFEPGAYSTAVVIILKDSGGTQLPVEAFTVGGGDSPSVNPITATQVMQPCGT
ncbi:MAG: hypothetical protein KF703_04880 [Actinobacteria bacterium]|nr:hypothetical protein [Actinomycetota bacterium]